VSPRAVTAALALLLAGCATTALERAAAIRADAERARKGGALACAPRELALAEANVSLAEADLSDGRSGLAEEHLRLAELGARRALELSRRCAPVAVRTEPPPAPPREKAPPPADPDTDHDGVVDRVDACPREPGPVENRGCPVRAAEEDRDHDGVPDRLDRCPDQVGPSPDGCPRKYTMVEVKRERIVIRQQVRFATGRSKVLPDSFALLGQVAQVLQDFPRMRVSIEGHTDSVGGEAANLKLSQQRAEAVRAWLVAKGIAPARLQAAGFGPTRPMASNGTARGREQNRRTEFRIVALE
jgi:outer membrane protein OmpA-like peptidoglycan-associated protein